MSEKDSKIFLDSYIQKDAARLVDNEESEENRYNMALYKNCIIMTLLRSNHMNLWTLNDWKGEN